MRATSEGTTRQRLPSRNELAADGVVHAVGLSAGIAGAVALIVVVAMSRQPIALVTGLIYAIGLLAMLGFSAAYSLGVRLRCRERLRRLDHAAIFAMIAGTYTPFTTMALDGAWAIGLTAAVWSIALFGIALKLTVRPDRIQFLSIVVYIGFGWIGLIAAKPFLATLSTPILVLLVAGGLIYTVGTVFVALDRMPYRRAIWHGFVLVAAAVHFSAVFDMMVTSG